MTALFPLCRLHVISARSEKTDLISGSPPFLDHFEAGCVSFAGYSQQNVSPQEEWTIADKLSWEILKDNATIVNDEVVGQGVFRFSCRRNRPI
jgi:hypothetical protein